MSKKKKDPNHKSGNSKYAQKLAKRKREAKALGLSSSTPYPVIWANR